MRLLQKIQKDMECWVCSRIAPQSYYDKHWLYIDQENADYSTMCILTAERANMPKRAIKAWQKWKAFYMFGEYLSTQEMRIRQMLAQRITSIIQMEEK